MSRHAALPLIDQQDICGATMFHGTQRYSAAPKREDVMATERTFDIEAFAARHSGVTVSRHAPGAVLFSQGDAVDGAYFIARGRVRITTTSSEGKEATVAVLDTGDFFGEGCLIGDRLRAASAICISDSTVVRLEQASAIRALHQDQAFVELFIARTLTNLVQLREIVASHILDDSQVRLARILMQLANRGGKGQATTIINVSQEMLAQMVGTTRSRINFFMNDFRDRGYIKYTGTTIIVRESLSVVLLAKN
jgi:CRP-like cAMP-binding protein